jgi:hypothetical protein
MFFLINISPPSLPPSLLPFCLSVSLSLSHFWDRVLLFSPAFSYLSLSRAGIISMNHHPGLLSLHFYWVYT